jgi:hypothetical protein
VLPSDSSWDLPGYDVLRLLGHGTSGEVWQGVEQASGDAVVLRRLPGADPEAVAAALAPLPSLPTDHLVRLRDVREVGGDVVLVLEHAPGGSLAGRRLTPGQVVTALAPIAQLLAAVHARGGRHGRITASEVLLSDDGRPLLDGLGLRALQAVVHDDVVALRELGLALLGDQAGPVRAALLDLAGDAGALAHRLLAACPAEPLVPAASAPTTAVPVHPEPAGPQARRSPRPGGRRRRVRLRVVAVPVVLAGSALFVLDSRSPVSAPADWVQVLTALDGQRAAAFAQTDPELLHDVYTAGSPALAEDTARLAGLAGRQQSVVGLRHRFLSVDLVQRDRHRVRLDLVAALTSYRLVGVDGASRAVAAGQPLRQRVLLLSTAGGWRLEELSASAEQPGEG